MSSWGTPRPGRGLPNAAGRPPSSAMASAARMQATQSSHYDPSSASGHRLGGADSNLSEARRAQGRMNQDRVAEHMQKEQEKKIKKLEEKLARDPRLKAATAPGNRLGVAAYQEFHEENKTHQPSDRNEESDNGIAMRELRLRQQERYNASIQMKPSAT